MAKFHVKVPEVWIQTVEVEADSRDEAIRRVLGGDGTYLDNTLEYSHTMAQADWYDAQEAP